MSVLVHGPVTWDSCTARDSVLYALAVGLSEAAPCAIPAVSELLCLQVLGTLITEWAIGAVKCLELFATKGFAEQFASQLSRIMDHYGFDGWLINIENPVLPLLLPNILHFLRQALMP